MDLQLRDKVAIVTGGSAGIGVATARLFLEEGARVAICARDAGRLEAAACQLDEVPGGRLHWATCDVLERDQVQAFVDGTAARFGGIDVLVNNAGHGTWAGSFFDATDEAWRREFDYKVFPVIHTVRAVHPYMKARGGGRIVNINSIIARQPEPHMIATGAARAGLLNMTRALANELAKDNIAVNSVTPGLIATGQWKQRHLDQAPHLQAEEWFAEIAQDRGIPLGRLGTPDEVANVVAFLASDRASYILGASVDVGGGVSRYV